MNKFNENPHRRGVWIELIVTSGTKKATISNNTLGVKISDNTIIFPKGYVPVELHVEVDAKDKCEAFDWPDKVTFNKGLATVILPAIENYNTLIYHVLG